MRRRRVLPAIKAPVLPQLIVTRASPDFTRSMALTIEESFFRFKACSGLSSIVITSPACRMEILGWLGRPAAVRIGRNTASSPTKVIGSMESSVRTSLTASTISAGPKSPPIASTAIRARPVPGLAGSEWMAEMLSGCR